MEIQKKKFKTAMNILLEKQQSCKNSIVLMQVPKH